MCKFIKKCVEILGELALAIYGLISLFYSALSLVLQLMFVFLIHEKPVDLTFFLGGTLTAVIIYVVSIAALTATVRMIEICDGIICCNTIIPEKTVRTNNLSRMQILYFCKNIPGYSYIKTLTKRSRTFMLISQVIFVEYFMLIRQQYYNPKKEEFINLPKRYMDFEHRTVNPLSPESVLKAIFMINFWQFLNQLFITGMVAMLILCGMLTSMNFNTPQNPEYEQASVNSTQDIEMTETYDPNNKDDIFAALQTRVDELKRKYSDIEKEFSRKKKQIPVMCPICMDNFDSSQQVIQLTCNKNHIFHEPCLFQWYSKNKNCPLCRVKNTHALPENLNIQ